VKWYVNLCIYVWPMLTALILKTTLAAESFDGIDGHCLLS